MRVRVSTQSGSLYVLDSVAMTWERANKRAIVGYDKTGGKLAVFPAVIVGARMQLIAVDPSYDETGEVPLITTTVVRAELI